jgi:hypothetical protein
VLAFMNFGFTRRAAYAFSLKSRLGRVSLRAALLGRLTIILVAALALLAEPAVAGSTIVGPATATTIPSSNAYCDNSSPNTNTTCAPTTNPNGDAGGTAVPGAPVFVSTSDAIGGNTQDISKIKTATANAQSAASVLSQDQKAYTAAYGETNFAHFTQPPHCSGNGCDDSQWNLWNKIQNTDKPNLKTAQDALNDATSNPPDPNPDTSGATCADQLTDLNYGLGVAGFATDLAGSILEAATSPAAEFGVEVASNVIEAVGIGLNLGSTIVEGVQNSLPNCEGVFTGTVETYANVVSKMGVNAFDGALNLGYTTGLGWRRPGRRRQYR